MIDEAEVAALIDAVRRAPERRDELLALLPEQAPVYAGRTSAEVTRLRGYLLAAFAEVGLPDEALPYALEVLESGHQPYEVAGAARAVRGHPAAAPYLARAERNLGGADATVSFERYDARWPYEQPTTVLAELRAASHGCCHEAEAGEPDPPVPGVSLGDLDVELEDQAGRPERLARFLSGRPAVLTFFYTRCESPYKCSLTISRLAELQASKLRIAAITYDPEFDHPRRLEAYGRDRGVRFGDDVRFFRATAGFDALTERLALGVGYGPSTVNRHRIELFLIDARGDVAASFTRMQWDAAAVLAAAEGLLAAA